VERLERIHRKIRKIRKIVGEGALPRRGDRLLGPSFKLPDLLIFSVSFLLFRRVCAP
jgi:hypothetical protein